MGPKHVVLDSGEKVSGSAVVVATAAPQARQLCGEPFRGTSNSVSCLYFAADTPPVDQGILTLNGEDQLEGEVRSQLQEWFGEAAHAWRHLRTYRIPYALPNQDPPALSPVEKHVQRESGIFVCGDDRDTASIQGAMASGRRAAGAVQKRFDEN